MADLNDLNKPALDSNVNNEVLETIRGHITRLWKGDYTGMGNLVSGLRRWVQVGTTDVKLVQRNAGGTEDTLYDSSLRALKNGTNATGIWPVSISGNAATAGTVGALSGAQKLDILSLAYPVGSIYTSTAATNPGTSLGFGTWAAFGAGRTIIGNGGGFTAGATGGSADAVVVSHSHTATVSDPGHSHSMPAVTPASLGGSANETIPRSINTNTSFSTSAAGTGISVSNASTGVSGTNANLPPYIVVYMWQRTA
jgi:hypothetical protein